MWERRSCIPTSCAGAPSICATQMHDGIIRKDTDHTPTQPLMTYSTHSLLTDRHTAVPTPTAATGKAIAEQQVRSGRDILNFPQRSHDPAFIDDGISCANSPLKVESEFAHGEGLGDQIEGGTSRQAGAVSCEDLDGRAVLRFVIVWWGEIK